MPDQIKAGEGRKPRRPVLPLEEETQTVMKWYMCHSLRLYCLYNHSKLTHCAEDMSVQYEVTFFCYLLTGNHTPALAEKALLCSPRTKIMV